MAIKAVFTDIDGVMVLSEHLHQEKIIMVAADPLGTSHVDPVNGVFIDINTDWPNDLAGIGDHRVYEWITKRNPDFPLSEEQFLGACEDYYLKNSDRLSVRPSYLDAIDVFAQNDLFIAAVSSGVRSQVDCNIAHAGLDAKLIFSHSADEAEAGKTKPHPAPYINALKELNARIREVDPDHIDILPHECLVIEDTGSGAQAGIDAGMEVAHWTLTHGKFNAGAHHKLEPDVNLDVFARKLLAHENNIPLVQAAPQCGQQPA